MQVQGAVRRDQRAGLDSGNEKLRLAAAQDLAFLIDAQRDLYTDHDASLFEMKPHQGTWLSPRHPCAHPLVVHAALEHKSLLSSAHGNALAPIWSPHNFHRDGTLNRTEFVGRLRVITDSSPAIEERLRPALQHVALDPGCSRGRRLLAAFALAEMTNESARLQGLASLGRVVSDAPSVRHTLLAWLRAVHRQQPMLLTHGSTPSQDGTPPPPRPRSSASASAPAPASASTSSPPPPAAAAASSSSSSLDERARVAASRLAALLRTALEYVETYAPATQCSNFVSWLLVAVDAIIYVARGDTEAWPVIEEMCKCPQLCDRMNVKQEFEYWLRLSRKRTLPFHITPIHSPLQARLVQQPAAYHRSYLECPCLLTAEVKLRLIRLEATYRMSVEYEAAFLNQAVWMEVSKFFTSIEEEVPTLDERVTNSLSPYLILNVRRDHLLEDTFNALSASQEDYHRPLKVRYSQSGEQGIDLGGVQKEFFRSVFLHLLCAETSMFRPIADESLYWINAYTLEPLRTFYYMGVLIGLAVYNSVNVRLNLPLAFFKQLLGQCADASDFRQMFPATAHGFEQLLNYPGDVAEDIGNTYTVSDSYLGQVYEHPLIEHGTDIVVTNDSRHQYVNDYMDYVLHKSVTKQMSAIRDGFSAVAGGWAVSLCTPTDLQIMICGRDDIDLSEMQATTSYIDYNENDPTIQHLWSFLDSLDDTSKRNFLLFVSGSARVPLSGLQSLHFTVQRAEHDNFSRLPTAMTCFNRLVLPNYPTKTILQQRLKAAIGHAEGFGLV